MTESVSEPVATSGPPRMPVTVDVNGVSVSRQVEPRSMLVDFLREDLGLTGTKVSCELQVCGVCTVLVDGRPVSSCTFLTADADGAAVTTVEGLSDGQTLHPLQESFVDNFALQCGFCTPGFLMMSKALLDGDEVPDREAIVEHLEGNICRCTGYEPIVEAVEHVAQELRGGAHG
ncbi:(2Fe-2S)-binding protein [Jiangella mangrovi]|uniref:Aerobic-type carbon monoxide dehydrogenase small subunit (CoxS/CutS family) n=1 Tax=Jiangella mangrovi TaxID=1524084 RepID=A0A7W9GNG4_9ACTN|nr:(2Fe-2S)-binding protein [Jiangella mangrovi]MBB5786893.1 aerobic-type carbon monoxide dehydrogenase small subunit (CoxS/CutS family) [Jiangella mangrovi]